MSQSSSSHNAAAGHGDGMQAHQGSLRSYLTGFVLAAILTIIPFWLVMGHAFSSTKVATFVILALAVVQIFVHVIYFLHLDFRSEGGWNLMAFVFTAVMLVVVLGASVWVMFTENALMMPAQMNSTMSVPISR
ncbi:MAG TPA: cytochrome o ubiquinol oxidase subunit IV [Rhodanobacteraceae bacterium]